MNNTLNLLIHDHWPATQRDCAWWLSDAQGRVLRWGRGEPSQWPLSPQQGPLPCRIFLYGTQVVSHYARLPKKDKACTPQVLASALEDELLTGPEGLALLPAPLTGEWPEVRAVASVPVARLMALRELCQGLGLVLSAVWPLAFCLAPGQACCVDEDFTLRLPDGGLLSLAADSGLAQWLQPLQALGLTCPVPCLAPAPAQLRADGTLIRSLAATGVLTLDQDQVSELAIPSGPGFLYGPLAPPAQYLAWWPFWRPVWRLSLGFALAAVLVLLAQTAWLSWQVGQVRQHIEADFRRIQPMAALVDPVRQTQRLLTSAQRQAGQLADDDFLRLLHVLAADAHLPGQVQQLTYEAGRLRVEAQFSAAQGKQLQEYARKQGLSVTQEAKVWILQVEGAQ